MRHLFYPNYEVILVDNGSTDGSVEFVETNYPEVRILRSKKNLGFAIANNVATEHARGEYVALLNNDTEVDRDWLSEMVRVAESDKLVAGCSSKLLMFNARQVINSAGGGMTKCGLGFDRGLYELDRGQYDRVEEVIFACAAASLFRKSVFQLLGGFDEKFFMYHDDVDLGWRIWLAGYKIVYVPTAKVYHKYGGTSEATIGVLKKAYYGERHAIRSLLKNAELGSIMKAMPHLLMHYLGGICYYARSHLFSLALTQAAFHFMKVAWNLAILPDTSRERLTTQRMRIKRDTELHRMISEGLPQIVVPDYPLRSEIDAASAVLRKNKMQIGVDDGYFLGYGWYPAEKSEMDPTIKFRWTMEEAHVFLTGTPEGGILNLEVYAIPELIGLPVRGRIKIGDLTLTEFELLKDGWQTVSCMMPRGLTGPVDISIITDTIWRPSKVFANNDPRRLGVGVKSISWEEAR